MSVLSDLKAELGYYANMLTWTVEDKIVKAVPKRQLSDRSHYIITRVFKHFGGNFVSKGGEHYFELVLRPRQLSAGNRIAKAYMELMSDGVFEETTTS